MIESGEVKVGDELPSERVLMQRFDVGRPSIREAFYTLEQRGRLKLTNGARARVVEPTAGSLVEAVTSGIMQMLRKPEAQEHLNDARTLFEVALARHAAEHATPEDLGRMKTALEANRLALAVGRPPVFARTDAEFHHALALVPRNPIFSALQRGFVEWLTERRNVTFEMPEADEISYRDHAALFDAIADGDADSAEQIMRQHLTFVTEVYRAVLQASREVLRDVARSAALKVIDKRASPGPRSQSRRLSVRSD